MADTKSEDVTPSISGTKHLRHMGRCYEWGALGRNLALQTCSVVLAQRGRYVTTIPSVTTFTNALASNLRRTLKMGNAQTAHTILVHADGQALSEIASFMSAGKARSVIDSVYPLSEVRAAHERSRSWRSQGKLVLQVRT